MNKRSQNTLISLVIWFVILTVFYILFFVSDGPNNWTTNRTLRLLSAGLMAMGFVVQFIGLFRNQNEPMDERVLKIQHHSSSLTVVITLIYVFVLSMGLYTIYESFEVVSVAWLYFIAYSTIFVSLIVNSGLYLLIERRGVGYED